ncbi:uncharacterized protein EAE97_006946 [Botrytis byssoidea]|uniref:Uncharacterized protein n=1 Tax=Botrytis byssoidea TaxID=139641 RepID=A0A9P5IL58_9HELO|nr:uncharacterized protein EAE97_006946 [Botrytis byssoidea]KAF7940760.1 hypothetical protein EAE97_006946 [Botrytis byssoidea]
MSDRSPREISYFWKDALQRTIFCGINPVGYPAFKNGHFKKAILEESDPLKSLEGLRDSKNLSDEEKTVVQSFIELSKPLFDNLTYNIHNPLKLEYEDLWNEVKKLGEIFGHDDFDFTKQELEIDYEFDENGVLKRMVTDGASVEELRPRLWDPKFHNFFMAARDKQSRPNSYEFTSSDAEYVDEPPDENSSGSTENETNERLLNDSNLAAEWDEIVFGSGEREIDRRILEDLNELVEQDEMSVRDGARAENTDDGDEMAADLSESFAPLTLIGTDEETQE